MKELRIILVSSFVFRKIHDFGLLLAGRLPGLILFIRTKKRISSMNTVITVNLTM